MDAVKYLDKQKPATEQVYGQFMSCQQLVCANAMLELGQVYQGLNWSLFDLWTGCPNISGALDNTPISYKGI